MANPKEQNYTTVAERPRDKRSPRFKAPAELPAEAGVQVMDDTHIQGVVSTDKIRALLDAFGLNQRREVSMPFHHIMSEHGERWSFRIEPAAIHQVEGNTVNGHSWSYRREAPETSQLN